MKNPGSSWPAELDPRVFVHLLGAPSGRGNIGPEHALGIRTEQRSLPDVVARIHHMIEEGWIDGRMTEAGVRHATLAPCLRIGLAEWQTDRTLGDEIRKVLADDDAGIPVHPERFVALRDAAVWHC